MTKQARPKAISIIGSNLVTPSTIKITVSIKIIRAAIRKASFIVLLLV